MPTKKVVKKQDEPVFLGPQVAEGENVFGVAHIFASFNDTFVHVTDLSGRETFARVTGGMKVRKMRAAKFDCQKVNERFNSISASLTFI